jgi:hypothetical protein
MWSHTVTRSQAVGLPWTSDRPIAKASKNTQQSQEKNINAPAGFEPTLPAKERPRAYALDGTVTGFGLYISGFLTFSDLSFKIIYWNYHKSCVVFGALMPRIL